MSKVSIPGPVSIRSQLGILTEDARVFHPITMTEALEVALLIKRDVELPRRTRKCVVLGIILDLMPGHLTPAKGVLATLLDCSYETIQDHELEWEATDQNVRFELTRRAMRMIIAARGSAIR